MSRCARNGRVKKPRLYTTREVVERADISRQTLQTWIATGRVKAPKVIEAVGVRFWTEEDLAAVLRVKKRKYPKHPRKSKGRR